jgi:hypothetical protein
VRPRKSWAANRSSLSDVAAICLSNPLLICVLGFAKAAALRTLGFLPRLPRPCFLVAATAHPEKAKVSTLLQANANSTAAVIDRPDLWLLHHIREPAFPQCRALPLSTSPATLIIPLALQQTHNGCRSASVRGPTPRDLVLLPLPFSGISGSQVVRSVQPRKIGPATPGWRI